ncbi:MAG: xanthine dehydrogenase family protein subunit M, partial [Pseudonocardiaceae bacterium]|nr:xanthine dehydrogenase family protein subunit M [Pseudonocardiaceae bacterium]
EARVLAGGQSLVPMMNFRVAQPAHLVDINPVAELDFLHVEGGRLTVGARARQSALERSPDVKARAPLLAEAVRHVGFSTVRHRGTVGGSIAHADPAGELPAAVLALDAELVVTGLGGTRSLPAAEFFRGPFETCIEPGELLTEIRLEPWPPGTGHAFLEFARAYHGFAVVGVAALVHLDGGRVTRAAVSLCGMAGTPVRAGAVEARLVGAAPTPETLRAAAALADDGLHPPSDV